MFYPCHSGRRVWSMWDSRSWPGAGGRFERFDEVGVDLCYEIHPAKICTMV